MIDLDLHQEVYTRTYSSFPALMYPQLMQTPSPQLTARVSSKAVAGGRTRIIYELTERGKQVLEAGLVKWRSHIKGAKKILGL